MEGKAILDLQHHTKKGTGNEGETQHVLIMSTSCM